MKVYRLTYQDDNSGSGTVAVWHPSARQAGSMRAKLRSEGVQVYGIVPIDVPTNKRGLLAFLNNWCEVS